MSEQAERYRRAADGFLARIKAVGDDQWDSPTPCPDWTARQVVAHVINEARRMVATLRGTEPKPLYGVPVAEMGTVPEPAADADLAAAWSQTADAFVAAIDDPACRSVQLPSPVGFVPFGQTLEALPEDVLIHTWDLARGTGGDERLDQDLVAHVYEHLKPLDEALRQPWAFGPRTPIPAGADVQAEFLCFAGRVVV
ncbi:TIGR03086 family metal-binding protein [Fodinicola acaciae]|uniref:TIGR03086 family metal-binding protein n=1 Tax=Fodinicola acaciae TaxID=2681555 RepID=UPI0013D68729|nr:TIGR03086 family metal-binding protein [Fodinicola acaciae]